MKTWKHLQADMIPHIRHQLQDMYHLHITSHGEPIQEWSAIVDHIEVNYPLHNNHF